MRSRQGVEHLVWHVVAPVEHLGQDAGINDRMPDDDLPAAPAKGVPPGAIPEQRLIEGKSPTLVDMACRAERHAPKL
jgi:hypothetical protein